MAGEVPFDQHIGAKSPRAFPGGSDLFAGLEINRHAVAVIRITRFDNDRQANVAGGQPGFVSVVDEPASGGWNTNLRKNSLCQPLVARDRLREVSGPAGNRSLNAPLARPVSQLQQAISVNARHGN